MEIKRIFREVLGWVVALILIPIIALILFEIRLREKIRSERKIKNGTSDD